MKVRRFLLISPYFPPCGDIGFKRALNLTRHIHRYRWQPVVLAANPAGEMLAPELMELVPASAIVSRAYRGAVIERLTRTLGGAGHGASKRSSTQPPPTQYLTPFDRYLWATPGAVREGLRMIRRYDARAIVVNADPWSGLLVGYLLHKRTGLPLIPDFRDPWSLHPGKMALRPGASQAVIHKFEEALFRQSAKIVLNCESALRAYQNAYLGRIAPERFTYIRNAFDRGIYQSGTEALASTAFKVVYFGSFRPFVGPRELIRGFSRFVSERRLSPEAVQFRVYGGPVDDSELQGHGISQYVQVRERVPLRQALGVLQDASVLVCLVEPGIPMIPAKLYDYLAARRPILVVSDSEEIRGIIEKTRTGLCARYGDAGEVASGLTQIYDGRYRFDPDDTEIAQFSAEVQAERFAAVLDEVTS